jgi:hypothetical protein
LPRAGGGSEESPGTSPKRLPAGEQRISARRSAESRFRFNHPTISPEHIAEIERWCCTGGDRISSRPGRGALGFGKVPDLFCRLCLVKKGIGILLRRTDRQHKLAALIGSPLGLFDFNGMAQIGQVSFGKDYHGDTPLSLGIARSEPA